GGAERVALEIAVRLDATRFRSTVCVTRMPHGRQIEGPARERREAHERLAAESGVRVLALGRRTTRQLWTWLPLVSMLLRERPAVIHGHMFGSNVWAVVIGRLTGVRCVVVHDHNACDTPSHDDDLAARAGRALRRWVLRNLIARWSSAVIAVSHAVRQQLVAEHGFDANRITTICNGIATVGDADGSRVRRELGIDATDPIVALVAMLRSEKAIGVLVEASALLVAEFPALKVLVAGDGPERVRLERMIAELGIGDTVVLLGIRADVPHLLDACDVAAMTSDTEGSPLAIMEYLEAGVPIVATRVGGVPELVEHGAEGLLVPARDPVALAGAIAELLRDPAKARAMGARGRMRRRREFDIDTTVRRVEQLYGELLNHSAPAPRTTADVPTIIQ
ncbi:MAG TPA: glycosyltransferase, partial [Solirubrobacteraceae bacterium]|nr:glycosyltransferase [Solirubrobacteraceae bacterium]